VRAFALSREYNTFSCHFIRGLLERETPQEATPGARDYQSLDSAAGHSKG
jgi:hypothetical protein